MSMTQKQIFFFFFSLKLLVRNVKSLIPIHWITVYSVSPGPVTGLYLNILIALWVIPGTHRIIEVLNQNANDQLRSNYVYSGYMTMCTNGRNGPLVSLQILSISSGETRPVTRVLTFILSVRSVSSFSWSNHAASVIALSYRGAIVAAICTGTQLASIHRMGRTASVLVLPWHSAD